MKVSYYPGCSLEATARDYRESLEYVCSRLGIELAEINDWSCCGATAAHSTDEFLSLALPARNLALAEQAGLDVVVPCPMCFNRLKTAGHELAQGSPEGLSYTFSGRIKVWDLLDFLSQPVLAGSNPSPGQAAPPGALGGFILWVHGQPSSQNHRRRPTRKPSEYGHLA